MRERSRLGLVLAVSLGAAACGDPIVPGIQDTLQSHLDALSEESALLSVATLGPALGVPRSVCTFDSDSKFFVCPGVTFGGFTYQHRYQLRTGSGSPLDSYDSDVVASVRLITVGIGTAQVMGVFQIGSSYELHRDRTLTGLLAGERILRGRDSSVMSQTINGNLRTDVFNHTSTNVVLPPGTVSPLWPESGVETLALLRTTAGTPTPYSYLMVMTYTGTDTARVTQFNSNDAEPLDCRLMRPDGTPGSGSLDCYQDRILPTAPSPPTRSTAPASPSRDQS